MARKGASAARLKALRKKYHLGEFKRSRGRKKVAASKGKKKAARPYTNASRGMPRVFTGYFPPYGSKLMKGFNVPVDPLSRSLLK